VNLRPGDVVVNPFWQYDGWQLALVVSVTPDVREVNGLPKGPYVTLLLEGPKLIEHSVSWLEASCNLVTRLV
jgi:hypothetical protein